MKLEQTLAHIDLALQRMEAGFRAPVFDEWAICEAGAGAERILHYSGTRSTTLQRQFLRDIHPLVEELHEGRYEPGHFYFSHEGRGALYDAFLCLGRGLFAVFNNTTRSMPGITSDALWRGVQSHFVDLSERLRADPLQV